MLTDLLQADDQAIIRRAQDTAWVAFGFTAIRLSRSGPIDPAQSVTAAGFDHSVAIVSGLETRSKSDMKWDVKRKRDGGLFGESGIHYYVKRIA